MKLGAAVWKIAAPRRPAGAVALYLVGQIKCSMVQKKEGGQSAGILQTDSDRRRVYSFH